MALLRLTQCAYQVLFSFRLAPFNAIIAGDASQRARSPLALANIAGGEIFHSEWIQTLMAIHG